MDTLDGGSRGIAIPWRSFTGGNITMRVRHSALGAAMASVTLALPIAAQSTRWCDQLPRPSYKDLERVRVADDWYQVYRVADHVFAIYEPYQFQEVISYLIVGTERALLF
ncbi:MAG: hypothetical protein ABI877_12525, partial [Gemmatimonadaceae bacterium]